MYAILLLHCLSVALGGAWTLPESREDYQAACAERRRAEEEQRQSEVDQVLQHHLDARRVCDSGDTLVSFAALDGVATPARLEETVRRWSARGWNVSLETVGVRPDGNVYCGGAVSHTRRVESTEALCLLRSDAHGGQFYEHHPMSTLPWTGERHPYGYSDGLDFREDCGDERVQYSSTSCEAYAHSEVWRARCNRLYNITVLRVSMEDAPIEASEPGQYRSRCAEARSEEARRKQEESDRFLARFFDEQRVCLDRPTYISLYRWGASREAIAASVAAMQGGWNISLVRRAVTGLPEVGLRRGLCAVDRAHSPSIDDGACLLTETWEAGEWSEFAGLITAGDVYKSATRTREMAQDHLLYECPDGDSVEHEIEAVYIAQ